MFATTRGTVRRNKLSDFIQVNRNGKIAMKLEEEGDEILAVETCTENDDVLLTTANGPVHPLPGQRRARLRQPQLGRRARHHLGRKRPHHLHGHPRPCRCRRLGARRLSQARHRRAAAVAAAARRRTSRWSARKSPRARALGRALAELKAREQFVLTVTRIWLRQALVVLRLPRHRPRRQGHPRHRRLQGRRDRRSSSRPSRSEDDDQIMLVSDGGQLIRVPVSRHPARQPRDQGRDDLQHRRRARRSCRSN